MLSCNVEDLTKIHEYNLRHGTFQVKIYKYKKCKGLWKKTEFENLVKWLQVGEVTVGKNEYIPFDSEGYYPIEYFEVEEAYEYDNSIFCGSPKETSHYYGLTCSPKTLKLIEKVEEVEVIGYKEKTEIFICAKCNTRWKIREEFDTQHGYARTCTKI